MNSNHWIKLLMAIGEATINFFKALLGISTTTNKPSTQK